MLSRKHIASAFLASALTLSGGAAHAENEIDVGQFYVDVEAMSDQNNSIGIAFMHGDNPTTGDPKTFLERIKNFIRKQATEYEGKGRDIKFDAQIQHDPSIPEGHIAIAIFQHGIDVLDCKTLHSVVVEPDALGRVMRLAAKDYVDATELRKNEAGEYVTPCDPELWDKYAMN